MKRILLIESGQFIGGVIHNLFASHERLDVIEASPRSSRELMRAVRLHRPEIVVLDDTVNPTYLARLLAYMQKCPELRVVVVNTSSNQVSVYQKQCVEVSQSEDLFAML